MIKRHEKFDNINGLDKELDHIISQVEETNGRVVTQLPPVDKVSELSKFYLKKGNKFTLHIKIDGKYRSPKLINNEIIYE